MKGMNRRAIFGLDLRPLLRASFAVAAVFFLGLGVARAQSQFGTAVGTVTDPARAAVPGATVKASNEASNLGFSTVSGQSGDYVIGGLLPGMYTITVEKTGFKDFRITGVRILPGNSTRADVQMELGAVAEQVTVTAKGVQLHTESGTVTSDISMQYLQKNATVQPANQMVGDTLLAMLPGQVEIGNNVVTAYGSRTYDRKITLDGSVISYGSTWVTDSGVIPPQGTIVELQDPALNADAEHQTANTTEMFTAKGTNDIHGSIWTELHNEVLDQFPFYTPAGTHKPGAPTVGYGYILGGPVYLPWLYNGKNKTFFYSTLAKWNYVIPLTTEGTFPTAAMQGSTTVDADLSPLGLTIENPYTQQPFTNSIIPANLISPIAVKFMQKYYYAPSTYYFDNATTYSPLLTPFLDAFERVDEQFGTKDALSVTYLHHTMAYDVNVAAASSSSAGGSNLGGMSHRPNSGDYINGSENHIFSPTALNEFSMAIRFGPRGSSSNDQVGAANTTGLGLPVIPGAPAGATGGPTFNITGMAPMRWYPDSKSNGRAYTFRDNLMWTRGRSSTKFGIEYIRTTSFSNSTGNLFGTYDFSGRFTGNGYADFMLGLPTSTSRSLPAGPSDTVAQQVGFYGQEIFRATRKFTVNIGLRAEKLSSPIELYGKYYNFDITNGNLVLPSSTSFASLNPGLTATLLSHIVANNGSFPAHLVNPVWAITPRVGLAYQLTPNTVVRGGFGSYGALMGLGGTTGSPYGAASQSFLNENTCVGAAPNVTCTPAFTLANPFPSSATAAVQGLSPAGVDPNYKTPLTSQWNLTAERRLPGQMVFRLTYAGSESVQLAYSADINAPPAEHDSINTESPQISVVEFCDLYTHGWHLVI